MAQTFEMRRKTGLETAGSRAKDGGNRVRNTSGNKLRRGLERQRVMGQNISSTGSALSGIGSDLMKRYNDIIGPSLQAAQRYADVNPQDYVDDASMDVNASFDKASGIQSRQLSRFGINPSSGKFKGATQDMNLMRAATEAGARNKARIKAEDTSYLRNMDLAQLGQRFATQAVGAHSAAANVGMNAASLQDRYNQSQDRLSSEQAEYDEYTAGGDTGPRKGTYAYAANKGTLKREPQIQY